MSSAIVTSLTWVRHGVAKAVPDKVELSKDELKTLIENSQRAMQDLTLRHDDDGDEDNDDEDNDDDDDDSDAKGDGAQEINTAGVPGADEEGWEDLDEETLAEYNLDDYDKEPEVPDILGSGFHNYAVYADNEEDPNMMIKDEEDEREDREDVNIKPSDNLIVVSKVQEDFTNLEIYVYNEEEGVLYVHHDIILTSFPLALEWLNFDPMEQEAGNLVAIGNMTPIIEVWDLDIINTVEPAYTLGKQVTKKSKKKADGASLEGHADAVLDLSWNRHLGHGLASASADQAVLLWDLQQSKAVSMLCRHTDKVQTVEWHPFEMQSLLSGGFDGRVNVCDCRNADSFKTWSVDGEVERVAWNHYQPFNFLASTDGGFVYNFDIRSDKPVFSLHAHEKAVTGVLLSPTVPDLLLTCSADNSYKIWDIQDNKPALVVSKDPKMGVINNAAFSPDSPFLVAMGGERDSLRLMDLTEHAPVMRRFKKRVRDPVLPQPSKPAFRDQSSASGAGITMEEEEQEEMEEIVEKASQMEADSASAPQAATRKKKEAGQVEAGSASATRKKKKAGRMEAGSASAPQMATRKKKKRKKPLQPAT